MDAFMKKLTKNIETKLSKLFVETHLYNFIRDFLYSLTKLLYAPKIDHLKITIELPIIGSNYMVLCNEPTLIQYDNNIFSEITTKKQEYIFNRYEMVAKEIQNVSLNDIYNLSHSIINKKIIIKVI